MGLKLSREPQYILLPILLLPELCYCWALALRSIQNCRKRGIKLNGDDIHLTLPLPTICYAKINHDRSKIYDANFIAKVFNPELIDKAYREGEIKIKDEAIKLGILNQAKINAKKLLGALLKGITKKNIVIDFKKTSD